MLFTTQSGKEQIRCELLVFCTLLGPEGPGRHFGVERILWTLLGLTPRVRLTGYRPYFENYTVDASILDM